VASRGLPGVARQLADELADLGEDDDTVVRLALRAPSTAAFLDVDTNLVRLLEAADGRAADDSLRARVLARLARELLGDASAAARRRALADAAVRLAASSSRHTSPDPATAVHAAGFTRISFRADTSIISASSATAHPAAECPPPRTLTGRP
jgi:hypothetical protein